MRTETGDRPWNRRGDNPVVVTVGADEIRAMLVELATHPDNTELRRRAAEALDATGQHDEAAGLLAPLVNVTGHDDDVGLPCLCKACLPRASTTAEASGMPFQRSFAVAGTRVLHVWMLAEFERDRSTVRASVAEALAARLALGRRHTCRRSANRAWSTWSPVVATRFLPRCANTASAFAPRTSGSTP